MLNFSSSKAGCKKTYEEEESAAAARVAAKRITAENFILKGERAVSKAKGSV